MGGGFTPNYGSPALTTALVQFVEALGRKYDGDNRIAFIHLGLLGFWYVLFVFYADEYSTRETNPQRHFLKGRVAHVSAQWTGTGQLEGKNRSCLS
jgi:hypothetical protein